MAPPLPIAKTPKTDLHFRAPRAIGSELGRQVLRGVLGSILGKKR